MEELGCEAKRVEGARVGVVEMGKGDEEELHGEGIQICHFEWIANGRGNSQLIRMGVVSSWREEAGSSTATVEC